MTDNTRGQIPADNFRLIAVYADKFPPYEKACMNFCSDYRLSVDGEDGSLLKVEFLDALPDRFFSLSENNNCVQSVSAIIAQNGCGKTSLARLLFYLLWGDYNKTKVSVVILFEQQGRINLWTTIQDATVRLVEGSGVTPKIRDLWKNVTRKVIDVYSQDYPFKLFYYSPCYTTEDVVSSSGESFIDISTTNLLTRPSGNLELLLRDNVKQTSIFAAAEATRVLEFAAAYQDAIAGKFSDVLSDFDIPNPLNVVIGTFTCAIDHAVGLLREKVRKCKEEESGQQRVVRARMRASPEELYDPVGEFLREIIDKVFAHYSGGSLFKRAFLGYSACHFSECGLLQQTGIITDYENKLRRFLLAHCEEDGPVFVEAALSFLKVHQSQPAINDPRFEELRCCNPAYDVFFTLNEMGKVDGDVLMVRLGDETSRERLNRLVRSHALSRQFTSFLRFDIQPKLASGEMSFLSLFARLYAFIREKTKKNEDVVLFMDEAETTLHLEWQRNIVYYVIKFLEVFMPDRRYHVIFASHSPVVLSDIPAGNVVFLKKERGAVKAVRVVDGLSEHRTNTFGANVYSLFDNNFFLEDGAVGRFATLKIKTLLDFYARKGSPSIPDSMRMKKLAKLVGDPVVAGYIKKLLELGLE